MTLDLSDLDAFTTVVVTSNDLNTDATPTVLSVYEPVPAAPLLRRSRTETLSDTPSSGEMLNGGRW